MMRKPKRNPTLRTVREIHKTKQQFHKMLHDSIRKKTRNIYDLNPKQKLTTNRIRGNGMSEEKVLAEVLKYVTGKGIQHDNHRVAQIVTRSLHSYPRLKHLYVNHKTHGDVQPAKVMHTSVPKNRVAAPSRILSV